MLLVRRSLSLPFRCLQADWKGNDVLFTAGERNYCTKMCPLITRLGQESIGDEIRSVRLKFQSVCPQKRERNIRRPVLGSRADALP
jgi:hypothetical protein